MKKCIYDGTELVPYPGTHWNVCPTCEPKLAERAEKLKRAEIIVNHKPDPRGRPGGTWK